MWNPIDIERWETQRRSDIGSVRPAVQEIIDSIRTQGDRALFELTERFDHARIKKLAVSKKVIQGAYSKVDDQLIDSLKKAHRRITKFHRLQKPSGLWMKEVEKGVTLGVKTTPLERIGMYIPGGRAAYPSTALMCAVPAKVAAVPEICCCSPPPIDPSILVALDISGVSEIYQVGGAQAIAAMALGTESIRKVTKIVGPGNVYVTAAKMMLRDHAEIDFPAGPSEVVVIADSSADPRFVASDIVAQMEHDPHAASILICTDRPASERIAEEIGRMVKVSDRKMIIQKAMKNSGYILCGSVEEAVFLSNRIAPEHLSIQTKHALRVLDRIVNAGSIFIGPYSPVAAGDYASGTNHVLPTAGYAKMYSGLNVNHFLKTSTVQMIGEQGLRNMSKTVQTIAKAEGLEAHANSVQVRRK